MRQRQGKQRTVMFAVRFAMFPTSTVARLMDARVGICGLQRHCTLPSLIRGTEPSLGFRGRSDK